MTQPHWPNYIRIATALIAIAAGLFLLFYRMHFGLGLLLLISGGFQLVSFLLFYRLEASKAGPQSKERQDSVREKKDVADASMLSKQVHFFNNVAHELKTPLALILGPLEHVRNNSKLEKDDRRLLDISLENGRYLQRLVEQLLDLSRIETNQLKVNLMETNLKEFVEYITDSFEVEAQNRAISFRFHLDAPVGATFMIDQGKVRQILYNLLSNAFKYVKEEDKVRLAVITTPFPGC